MTAWGALQIKIEARWLLVPSFWDQSQPALDVQLKRCGLELDRGQLDLTCGGIIGGAGLSPIKALQGLTKADLASACGKAHIRSPDPLIEGIAERALPIDLCIKGRERTGDTHRGEDFGRVKVTYLARDKGFLQSLGGLGLDRELSALIALPQRDIANQI